MVHCPICGAELSTKQVQELYDEAYKACKWLIGSVGRCELLGSGCIGESGCVGYENFIEKEEK